MISIKGTTRHLASFLLGGAIGGTLALLYAPKPGKHLRNDISRKTNELIEEGKKKTFDSWNGAKEKVESTLDSANDFLNTGKEKIVRKTEQVKDALKSGLNAYNDERKSGSDPSSASMEDAGSTHRQTTPRIPER
jgi:gas vesicle protein